MLYFVEHVKHLFNLKGGIMTIIIDKETFYKLIGDMVYRMNDDGTITLFEVNGAMIGYPVEEE